MNRIINFHDVQDQIWFESVIKLLKKSYSCISIKDIESYYSGKTKLVNSCHITVDDGCNSFYEVMYPILKKHNIPATIFVSPYISQKQQKFWFQEIKKFNDVEFKKIIADNYDIDFSMIREFPITSILKIFTIDEIWNLINLFKEKFKVGESEKLNMDIETIKKIDKENLVTIGAHTITHPILANENDISSKRQIKRSIEDLSNILNKKVICFAYPNGTPSIDFGKREIRYLKENGIKIAFSTESRSFKKSDNPLNLPRVSLEHGSNLFVQTKLKIGRFWEVLKKIKGIDEKRDRARLRVVFKK
jgi:peptidoglycan/xylan/chitin deacetylase (PgdA/CDA1 family)